MYGINVNFSLISGKKLFWRSAKVDVSLSELNALSECHPLSEASTRLADRRNLEGNLSCRHALNASSAHLASRLSPSRLSASLALRKNSLTRAKRENGAKCDVEVSEPFLSLE